MDMSDKALLVGFVSDFFDKQIKGKMLTKEEVDELITAIIYNLLVSFKDYKLVREGGSD